RDKVDALLEADERVAPVLLGERRQVHLYARQVDVAPRAELARDEHATADVRLALFQHFEPEEALVDEDNAADGDVGDEVLVVDIDRANFLAALALEAGFHGEVEDLAGLELDRCGEVAGANLWALDVHHDRDLAADARADGADATDDA